MKNQAKAFIAFNKFANARVKLIEELRAAGYKTAEEAREVCILWVSHKTGVPAIEKSSGLLKLDSSHAKYQGARTALRDLMHMIGGTTRRESSGKKEVDKVDKVLALIAEMTAAERKQVLRALQN